MVEAGGGRSGPEARLDHGVSLRVDARLGQEVAAGDELARLYLRRDDDRLVERVSACFAVADEAAAPELILDRI